MTHKIRSFIYRVLNFFRPKIRYAPLLITDILENHQSASLVSSFNDFYYSSGTSGNLNWRGSPLLKNPCDLWMIIELFQKLKPRIIIETGTHHGGSASFYADILKTLGFQSEIITIDINPKWNFNPQEKGIHSIIGYSTDQKIFQRVKKITNDELAKTPGNVMVFLDSDHSQNNVYQELGLYSKLVNIGSYIVVEDTNVNGHPSFPKHGPGPYEATEQFLLENLNFERDHNCQRFMLTFNPGGWLKRIR